MRRWAWVVMVGGGLLIPLGILASYPSLDFSRAFLAVMGLAQVIFAALYLMNRASRAWALVANGAWLLGVIGEFPMIPSLEGVARWLGGVAGSLPWAGLALWYSYTTHARDLLIAGIGLVGALALLLAAGRNVLGLLLLGIVLALTMVVVAVIKIVSARGSAPRDSREG